MRTGLSRVLGICLLSVQGSFDKRARWFRGSRILQESRSLQSVATASAGDTEFMAAMHAYFSVQSPARHSPVHFRLCRSFSRHGVVVILGCNSQCVASSEVAIGCLFQYFGTMRGEITLKVEPLKLQTETFTRLQAPSEAAVSGTLAESA